MLWDQSATVIEPRPVALWTTLPCIADDTFACIAARDVRELAFECRSRGPAGSPPCLERRRRQRGVARLRCAADHEGRTGQRLERGGNIPIMVEVAGPGEPTAQRHGRVLHHPGFVGPHAELGAWRRHAARTISEPKSVR